MTEVRAIGDRTTNAQLMVDCWEESPMWHECDCGDSCPKEETPT